MTHRTAAELRASGPVMSGMNPPRSAHLTGGTPTGRVRAFPGSLARAERPLALPPGRRRRGGKLEHR
jgi:hypothetical protein